MRDFGSRCAHSVTLLSALFVLVMTFTAYAEDQKPSEVESRYLHEVNKNAYDEVETPEKVPVFRWDFSTKKTRAFSYEQEVVVKTEISADMGKDGIDPEQILSSKGTLLIKSQGDGTAELVLKDLKASMQITVDKSHAPETMEQAVPPFGMQGLKEDGTGPFGDSSQDMMLKLIFPLPTKALKVGESVDVPAQMPFNAMGSQLQVKGRSHITLAKYVLVGSRTCAQLNVDIDISDLKVPSELEGKYSCSTKGSAVFFFDVNSRSFVSGTTALLMRFSIDAPMPKMKIQGETPQDSPERVKMGMKSDNLIRVSLQE